MQLYQVGQTFNIPTLGRWVPVGSVLFVSERADRISVKEGTGGTPPLFEFGSRAWNLPSGFGSWTIFLMSWDLTRLSDEDEDDTGELEPTGIQGPYGYQGSQGLYGLQGYEGWQGFQGNTGTQGYQGWQGVVGETGTIGPTGPFGGAQGHQGGQGWQGTNPGPPGIQGFQGVQGLFGGVGGYGPQGVQGLQGVRGYIQLEDQKVAGSSAQSLVAGVWQTRALTVEVVDTSSDCSLAANRFTLAAGTYEIDASASIASLTGTHRLRLRNVTDGSTTLLGQNVVGGPSAVLVGRFTIGMSKIFELQHRTSGICTGGTADGWDVEVYAVVMLRKTS